MTINKMQKKKKKLNTRKRRENWNKKTSFKGQMKVMDKITRGNWEGVVDVRGEEKTERLHIDRKEKRFIRYEYIYIYIDSFLPIQIVFGIHLITVDIDLKVTLFAIQISIYLFNKPILTRILRNTTFFSSFFSIKGFSDVMFVRHNTKWMILSIV